MSRQTIAEFLEARIAEDKEEAEHFLERYKQGEDISKRRWLRILREAEAKQAILANCREDHEDSLTRNDDTVELASVVLYSLAAVYRDHPDYRQEWVE